MVDIALPTSSNKADPVFVLAENYRDAGSMEARNALELSASLNKSATAINRACKNAGIEPSDILVQGGGAWRASLVPALLLTGKRGHVKTALDLIRKNMINKDDLNRQFAVLYSTVDGKSGLFHFTDFDGMNQGQRHRRATENWCKTNLSQDGKTHHVHEDGGILIPFSVIAGLLLVEDRLYLKKHERKYQELMDMDSFIDWTVCDSVGNNAAFHIATLLAGNRRAYDPDGKAFQYADFKGEVDLFRKTLGEGFSSEALLHKNDLGACALDLIEHRLLEMEQQEARRKPPSPYDHTEKAKNAVAAAASCAERIQQIKTFVDGVKQATPPEPGPRLSARTLGMDPDGSPGINIGSVIQFHVDRVNPKVRSMHRLSRRIVGEKHSWSKVTENAINGCVRSDLDVRTLTILDPSDPQPENLLSWLLSKRDDQRYREDDLKLAACLFGAAEWDQEHLSQPNARIRIKGETEATEAPLSMAIGMFAIRRARRTAHRWDIHPDRAMTKAISEWGERMRAQGDINLTTDSKGRSLPMLGLLEIRNAAMESKMSFDTMKNVEHLRSMFTDREIANARGDHDPIEILNEIAAGKNGTVRHNHPMIGVIVALSGLREGGRPPITDATAIAMPESSKNATNRGLRGP